MQVLKEFQCLFQTGRHQEIPGWGKLAKKQLEYGSFLHSLLKVALQHGQLVMVGQQRTGERVHSGTMASKSMSFAPRWAISSSAALLASASIPRTASSRTKMSYPWFKASRT